MSYIYNIKNNNKLLKVYDKDFIENKNNYNEDIIIILTDIQNICHLENIKYIIIDNDNFNNINLIDKISKIGNKLIFLYTGFSNIEIIKNRVDLIKNNLSDCVIIHTQVNLDSKKFNLSAIESYFTCNVDIGIKCNNFFLIITSIAKKIIYIDYNLTNQQLENINLVYNSLNLQKTKIIEKCELDYINQNKKIAINKKLMKGDIINISDLTLIKSNQIDAINNIFIDKIIGKKIIKNLSSMDYLTNKHLYKFENLIIGDSLLNRGYDNLDYIIPWIGYSENFPHFNNKYDTYQNRNTGYLKNLKLKKFYENIVIQLGINDCAPRKMKYKLIKKNDPNIGFLFDRLIPDKDFLDFIKFKSCNINDYIRYSNKNSKYIQKKYYEYYGFYNSCIDKNTFQNNIEIFYNNNFKFFNNIYFLSIIKCNSIANKSYKSNQIINEYNNIVNKLQIKLKKLKYIEISDQKIINKITFYTRNDNWVQNKFFKEDGYHLSNENYIFLSNYIDLKISSIKSNNLS